MLNSHNNLADSRIDEGRSVLRAHTCKSAGRAPQSITVVLKEDMRANPHILYLLGGKQSLIVTIRQSSNTKQSRCMDASGNNN